MDTTFYSILFKKCGLDIYFRENVFYTFFRENVFHTFFYFRENVFHTLAYYPICESSVKVAIIDGLNI